MDKFEEAICRHNPLYKEGLQDKYYQGAKWAWQSRQAEVDELSSQNQILKEVAESDMKTIERLESVINLNDSELKEKDKRIEELELALTQIKSWESHPKNYGIDFGSWGLRDFYRDLADKALRGEHE